MKTILKDEIDYNEAFVDGDYVESDGEVSIELAPSLGKWTEVQLLLIGFDLNHFYSSADDNTSENKEIVEEDDDEGIEGNVESPVITSSQVLRDFSLRSESRSSQSSYSESM